MKIKPSKPLYCESYFLEDPEDLLVMRINSAITCIHVHAYNIINLPFSLKLNLQC